MAKTRKKKSVRKSSISQSEAIKRGIKAIMRMRNENKMNQMPPEYIKNVENMLERRGLNKDGSPIFYDVLNSSRQNNDDVNSPHVITSSSQNIESNNNGFLEVGKNRKRKTKKKDEQKKSKGSNTKKSPNSPSPKRKISHKTTTPPHQASTSALPRGAAEELPDDVIHVSLPGSIEKEINKYFNVQQHMTFAQKVKHWSVPNYDSFWSRYAKESEFVDLKKTIQAILSHDIEHYSTQNSHDSVQWISGKIAKKVFGRHFHLSLKNTPEDKIDFKTGRFMGMTFDLPYDYNVSQIIISLLSILVCWINKKLLTSRSCKFLIMTKGGRVIQHLGHEHESFDLDLLIVPKSILTKTNPSSILKDYNDGTHSRELAHEIMLLLQWFCELKDKVELSIMTPDHERAVNKSIFKLSMIKTQNDRLGKIKPMIDLGFTWVSPNGTNHTNTLPFFTEPVMTKYNLSLLKNMDLQLLQIHQSKQQYKNEKAYILDKESRKPSPNREEKTITKMKKQLKMLK